MVECSGGDLRSGGLGGQVSKGWGRQNVPGVLSPGTSRGGT